MVRVSLWRGLAIVALCHSLVASGDATVASSERNEEPTTFVTSAATPDKEPIRLVLPLLLDVQPLLLSMDVMRHVPAQIQSFCRNHGVDVTRCYGAVQQVLDEVVDFRRFCKTSGADSALPGFGVAKNVLRESGDAASAVWLQNDPEDVAIDFCGFAKAKMDGEGADECAVALGKAVRLSFNWILALTPCEQQSTPSDDATAAASETPSIVERVAEVEEMIAALQSSSASGGEDVPMSIAEELGVGDASSSLTEESESVQEIIEAEEAVEASSSESEVAGANTGSCEASYGAVMEGDDLKNDSDQSWKVGAALVLALAIVYLAIDLMIHVVHYTAGFLEAPKQLVNVFLHDALLLIRGGPHSTLAGSDELKKPVLRGAKISAAMQPSRPQLQSNCANADASKSKAVADVLHHASPSFTRVAVLLMASSHAPVPHESFSPAQDSVGQRARPTPSFVQDSRAAINAIQQKYRFEISAAQCIQKAWKASQRKRSSQIEALQSQHGKPGSSAPIFRLLQLRSMQEAQLPRGDPTRAGLHRLVPNTLPPL